MVGWVWSVGFGRLGFVGLVWYVIVVLDDMTLLNIALYCSKAETRVSVGGWVVCKVIFVSNQTTLHCFGLLVGLWF